MLMLRQLVHSKSDTNFFATKEIIDDISNNMQRIKKLKKMKQPKANSPINSGPSTPTSTSCSSFNHSSNTSSPKNAHHFFTYLIQILKIKKVFEKGYFRRFILPVKLSNNIITQVIREYAKREFSRFDVSPQLINDFDQIINIINSVTPETLFKEIKTKILVAFEIVQQKIKTVLQSNKQTSSIQQISFFNFISHMICFILSTITYRVDYYSFTMNRFVEKLNKYFDSFLDDICPGISLENSNEYNFCLRFIQRFIKIKLKFIDEFYQEEMRFTKFNSLGRFLFNNLNEFLSLFNGDNMQLKEGKPVNTSMFDKSYWIHYKSEVYHLDDSSCKLNTFFKMFFNSRLAKWKNDFFHPILSNCSNCNCNAGIDEEEEICRICEQKIKLHHYYLHIYYCLNYVISYQALKKNRKIIKGHIKRIEEINQQCDHSNGSCSNTIDGILMQVSNENNCPFDSYENDSGCCIKLLKLINEIMINCISNNNTMNCFNSVIPLITTTTITTRGSTVLSSSPSSSLSFHSSCVNRSLLQLVSVLMKRFRIIVDILTIKEMRTKNKLSYCNNHLSRLSPIMHKNMSKSSRQSSDRKAKFDNYSLGNQQSNTDDKYNSSNSCFGKKSTDFSSLKIKQTLNELKTITQDELLNTKVISKSKFGQSYNNENYNSNLTLETTIEIYPDLNQDLNNEDSPIMAIIPKISDFTLICPIAKGGYGRVDLYKKISTGDMYAIKTVFLDSMQDSSQAELLKNETSISNEIDSEYIVKCYYIICENSHFYFVSEYMAGRDLLQLLNSTILSYETIQLITAEIVLGIEYLHSKGIVHKDIKPENVVISKDGHFKLTDFGISEIYNNRGNKYTIGNTENIYQDLFDINDEDFDDNENDNDTEGYSNTKKDQLGTLYYMAPEVFTNDQFTTAVDYWSLGVLLYELFTLKQPFYGSNTQEIKKNIISEEINWSFFDGDDVISNYSLNELNNAKDLITKLLIKDVSLRYSTKDLSKIKSHPFFNGFNWKEIKPIKDPLVLLHVKKIVEKTNQQIKEHKKAKLKQEKHNNQTFPQVLSTSEKKKFIEPRHPFYYSERVDNIFKKCQETMHRIINSNKFKETIDLSNKENNSFNTSASSTSTSTALNNSLLANTLGSNPFTNFDN